MSKVIFLDVCGVKDMVRESIKKKGDLKLAMGERFIFSFHIRVNCIAGWGSQEIPPGS